MVLLTSGTPYPCIYIYIPYTLKASVYSGGVLSGARFPLSAVGLQRSEARRALELRKGHQVKRLISTYPKGPCTRNFKRIYIYMDICVCTYIYIYRLRVYGLGP